MNIENIQGILSQICNKGGTPKIVGGFVRDSFLGIPSKDFDVEVFNISLADLKEVLSPFGNVEEVGKSFGVLKLRFNGEEIDFSLPRRENKEGQGHKGFIVESDPNMTPQEASARRDFTFNSMMMNPFSGNIEDFWGGREDLLNKIIRHTSEHFAEDPLRVLRSVQFAGRFDMSLHPETANLSRSLLPEFETIPVERIWVEWEKWAAKSVKPSKGIQVLLDSGWIVKFPELNALFGLAQEPRHHPEGCAGIHSMHVLDHVVEVAARENLSSDDRTIQMFSALCHDFGKPATTAVEDGQITTKGHDVAGEEPTRKFLERIGCPPKFVEPIVTLVVTHMFHVFLKEKDLSPRVVRRFANRLGKNVSVQDWARVVEADHSGRPPLEKKLPEVAKKILEMSKDLKVENGPPEPILMGRHLIENFKMKPGKDMGDLLKKAMQAQIDGDFGNLEEAFNWVEKQKVAA